MQKEPVANLCIFIRSQQAEATPPLGTVLGNLGLNAIKFCKEFNDFTQELPSYFYLRVFITIFEDKSFSLKVAAPTIGFILSLAKYDKTSKIHGKDIIEHCISLKTIVETARFKLPQEDLPKAVPIVLGTALSAGLKVTIEQETQ
jgi:large subunit ribosomal protein L11